MSEPSFTLRPKHVVDFDCRNPKHLEAIMEVIMNGRLPKEYRFAVQPPFQSVTEMAKHIMAVQFCRDATGKEIRDTYFNPAIDLCREIRKIHKSIPTIVDDNLVVLPSVVLGRQARAR